MSKFATKDLIASHIQKIKPIMDDKGQRRFPSMGGGQLDNDGGPIAPQINHVVPSRGGMRLADSAESTVASTHPSSSPIPNGFSSDSSIDQFINTGQPNYPRRGLNQSSSSFSLINAAHIQRAFSPAIDERSIALDHPEQPGLHSIHSSIPSTHSVESLYFSNSPNNPTAMGAFQGAVNNQLPSSTDLPNAPPPIYVNAKQYNRIMIRRNNRIHLESMIKSRQIESSKKTSYLHESRHKHAMKRLRGPTGRFLTVKEIEAAKAAKNISLDSSVRKPGETNHSGTDVTSTSNSHSNINFVS